MSSPNTAPRFTSSLLVLLITAGLATAAPYIDNFDSATNIEPFGAVTTSVADNVLTASRNAGNEDSGFNWRIGGNSNFSLQTADQQFIFSLTAAAPLNGGFYSIRALVFDSLGGYLDELSIQTDTNLTGTFEYDIASIASSVAGAEQWFPRVRILPFDSTDAGFEFQNFQAVPEPSTYALLAMAGVLVAAAWRRRRA